MSITTPAAIATSVVFGYVFDGTTAVEGAVVTFRSPQFMLDDNLITIDVEVETDSDGRYQATLPQTVSTGTIVTVDIRFLNSAGDEETENESIIVPATTPVSVQAARAQAAPPAVITGGPQGPPGPAGSLSDQLVADIADPTEIELLGIGDAGRVVLAYSDPAAAENEGTLYLYDADSGLAKDAPFVMNTGDAGTSRWIAVSGRYKRTPLKEVFIPASANDSNLGNYATHSIGTNGLEYLTFSIPADFTQLISLEIECIATFTNTGRNIDLFSSYAMVGEPRNQNTESDTTSTYDFVTDEITALDVSGIFTALAAGHLCGIQIDHNAIGGTIHYLGVRMRYN